MKVKRIEKGKRNSRWIIRAKNKLNKRNSVERKERFKDKRKIHASKKCERGNGSS